MKQLLILEGTSEVPEQTGLGVLFQKAAVFQEDFSGQRKTKSDRHYLNES